MKKLPECKFIIDRLTNELPSNIYYHNIDHTLDVYQFVKIIAENEGINPSDLKLLQIAALYHDAGHLIENKNHELHSCEIARASLPQFNYSKEDINTICSIIMATEMPQNPKTLLEEIICDADLNYLGRTDFFLTSKNLYKEMLANGTINNWGDWMQIQAKFLQQHHFFTKTARKLRKSEKEKNLKIIQSKNILK